MDLDCYIKFAKYVIYTILSRKLYCLVTTINQFTNFAHFTLHNLKLDYL